MEAVETESDKALDTILYFTDDRLVNNARFICATWNDEDDVPSTSLDRITNIKSVKIEEPLELNFLTDNNFIKLSKLHIVSKALRQPAILVLPEDFRFGLPNLKCLNIDLWLPEISWIFPLEEELVLNENCGKNFVNMLSVIDCPLLSSFHFKTNEDKYRESNWEFEVFEFLKTKEHLKILDLTFGNGIKKREDCQPYVSGVHPMARLEVLFVEYCKGERQFTTPLPTIPNYWALLLNQSHLQVIDLMGVPDITLNEFQFLVRRNQVTVKVVRFHFLFCDAKRSYKFDGDAFRNCTALRHLTVNPGLCNQYPRNSRSTILNFDLFPKTLTTLQLSNIKIETTVFKALEAFKNLESLQLMQCGSLTGYGIAVDTLCDLLRLRKLNKLVALPIVLHNKEESVKLEKMEKLLKDAGPEFRFLRHVAFREPAKETEAGFFFRYCTIT